MNPETREELRVHLEQRRRKLIEEGDLRAEPNRDEQSIRLDEDAQPLNEMNQAITSRRNQIRAQELKGIDVALRRLEEEPDEYGRCVECDEWIPLGRLKLMPWAQRCVPCQSDRGGPQRGYRRRHARDFVD